MSDGVLISDYSNSDSNILALQSTSDKAFRGNLELTLTEFDSSTVPAIAAGSIAECNGALYSFASECSISTTDPTTSATVADGTVYILLVPDTGAGTISAAFTATAPTFSDSKGGWYGTGDEANYGYAPFILSKSSTSYSKHTLRGNRRFLPFVFCYIDHSFSGTTEEDMSLSSTGNYTDGIDLYSEVGSSSITFEYSGLYEITVQVKFQISSPTSSLSYSAGLQMDIDGSIINSNGSNTQGVDVIEYISAGTGSGSGYCNMTNSWIGFVPAGSVFKAQATIGDTGTSARADGTIVIKQVTAP